MKEKNLSRIIYTILFIICFMVTFQLTYYKIGDYYAHCSFAEQLSLLKSLSKKEFLETVTFSHILSYPIWHICFLFVEKILLLFRLDYIFNKLIIMSISSAVVTSMFYTLSYGIIRRVFKQFVKNKSEIFYSFVPMSLLLIGPYYLKVINPAYYLGQGTPNPWHNPTTITVSGISIACFFLYGFLVINLNRIKDQYFNVLNKYRINKIDAGFILFSFMLAMSCFFKPSFFQMFLPGLFLFCLIEFFCGGCKDFWFYFKTGLSILPTVLIAFFQMSLSFSMEGDGIGISFLYVWREFSPHPLLSLLISMIFPLFVFVVYFLENKKNTPYKLVPLTIFTFLSGMLQFMFFYKKIGAYAGDFAWGFYLSLMILFISSWIILEKIENIACKKLAICLYVPHLCFGILYIWQIIMNLNVFGGLY